MATPKRVSLSKERFRLISRALADPCRHEILEKIGEAKIALACYQILGGLRITAHPFSPHEGA